MAAASLVGCASSESQAFCDAAAAVSEYEGPFDELGGDADAKALEEAVTKADELLRNLADNATSEASADALVVADSFSALAAAISAHNFEFADFVNDPEALNALESLDSPEVETAIENLNDYTEVECNTGLAF